MADLLLTSDFTGFYRLTKNQFSTEEFKEFIAQCQEERLIDLLGDDLFLLFEAGIADIGSARERVTTLINGINYDFQELTVKYDGVEEMLKGFTFAKYVNEQPWENTIIGFEKGLANNAVIASEGVKAALALKRYNRAVDFYRKAQDYIERENQQPSLAVTSIVDQTGNIFLVTLSDTSDLINGDTVEIDKTVYFVENIIVDTSFEISETSGTTFSAEAVVDFQWYATARTTDLDKETIPGLI